MRDTTLLSSGVNKGEKTMKDNLDILERKMGYFNQEISKLKEIAFALSILEQEKLYEKINKIAGNLSLYYSELICPMIEKERDNI